MIGSIGDSRWKYVLIRFWRTPLSSRIEISSDVFEEASGCSSTCVGKVRNDGAENNVPGTYLDDAITALSNFPTMVIFEIEAVISLDRNASGGMEKIGSTRRSHHFHLTLVS
jgi:hypothetical protein